MSHSFGIDTPTEELVKLGIITDGENAPKETLPEVESDE